MSKVKYILCVYTFVYISISMCVCVCVCIYTHKFIKIKSHFVGTVFLLQISLVCVLISICSFQIAKNPRILFPFK